ncbi:inositol-1-monophosphatase [hydrocarbon metagenome]|uniref:inositol-phosphate phosphatase n=1 Tax=hydrocarbon metagenome TaxID=938273 RepID=A0A0W8G4R7_9ZZZZ
MQDLLARAAAVVHRAGDIIRDQWGREKTIRKKGRIDLVTQTDTAVERFLVEELGRLLPDSRFLAEESAATTVPGPRTWIIDPIDGTTNYAHGFPFVCISVALWDGDRVSLGIVHAPMLGETFLAAAGGGATCNGRPMRVSDTAHLGDALLATGFPYAIETHLADILGELQRVLAATQGVRRPGSAALDLAYTADGRFDAFYERALNPWDTAAGWLLVTEAGGCVTQYLPSAPYGLGAPTILASNGRLHTSLLDLLTT